MFQEPINGKRVTGIRESFRLKGLGLFVDVMPCCNKDLGVGYVFYWIMLR